MKRVFSLIFTAAVGILVLAPVSFSLTESGVKTGLRVAEAGNLEGDGGIGGSGGSPFKNETCSGGVKIALPIIGNNKCISNNSGTGGAVVNYLRLVLRVLSGAVGLVVILMLVIGGIQYITSIGDPTAVKNAKNRVINAFTALALFLMMFAILSFLVPGGIL